MFSKLTGSAAKAKKRYLSPVARVSGVDDGDDGMLAMMGVRFFCHRVKCNGCSSICYRFSMSFVTTCLKARREKKCTGEL